MSKNSVEKTPISNTKKTKKNSENHLSNHAFNVSFIFFFVYKKRKNKNRLHAHRLTTIQHKRERGQMGRRFQRLPNFAKISRFSKIEQKNGLEAPTRSTSVIFRFG